MRPTTVFITQPSSDHVKQCVRVWTCYMYIYWYIYIGVYRENKALSLLIIAAGLYVNIREANGYRAQDGNRSWVNACISSAVRFCFLEVKCHSKLPPNTKPAQKQKAFL